MASKAQKIVDGLGGVGNIVEIEACITRLRTEVVDPAVVNERALKSAGAHGVVQTGTEVQVVVGTGVHPVATEIEALLRAAAPDRA